MSRIGPRRTEEEQMAEAIMFANKLFAGKFWLFGKGRVRPDEPLYGFSVFEPGDPDNPIAEAEHDDPVECVMRAIEAGRKALEQSS